MRRIFSSWKLTCVVSLYIAIALMFKETVPETLKLPDVFVCVCVCPMLDNRLHVISQECYSCLIRKEGRIVGKSPADGEAASPVSSQSVIHFRERQSSNTQ